MAPKSCLRCDWQGETKEPACPNCGVRPLYVLGVSSPGERTPTESQPQERSPEPASAASTAPSFIPSPPAGPALPPTEAVEPSGRSMRSTVAFVVAAVVLTVSLGTWLNAHAERSVPTTPTGDTALGTPSSADSPTPAVPQDNGALVRIDAVTGTIASRVPIRFPKLLATDGSSVWVFDEGDLAAPQLIQVDARNDGLPKAADIRLPDALVTAGGVDVATALAAAGGSLWLRDDAGEIYVLRPDASAVEPTTFDALGSLNIDAGLAGTGDSLWVPTHPQGPCCTGPSDLQQVDPETGKVMVRIDGAGQVVASGPGFVWTVVDPRAHAPRLKRFDTETHVTTPIGPLNFVWADLTVAKGAVWASSPEDDTIVRLDPMTGQANDWVHLDRAPGALDAGAGAIWIAFSDEGTVARYDIATGRIDTIDVGGTPNDLVFAHGSIWVSVLGSTGLSVAPGPIVLDLRTSGTTRLAESLADGTDFAASSDGMWLAYVDSDDEGTQQIFIARIDGTEVRQVTHDPTGATSPAWSPDGSSIAYLGHEHYLAVLDLATGGSTGIVRVLESGFQFTPDGSSLLYTGGSPNHPELRTVAIAGGKSKRMFGLGKGLTHSRNGSLSPDGSLLTFVGSGSFGSGHCTPCHFVANADGTEKRVIQCHGSDPAGTWSPDGSRIVCMDGSVDGIIVVDIATGDASPVVVGGMAAIWLDRHTLLVEGSGSPTASGDATIESPTIPRQARTVAGVRFSFRVPTEAWGNGPVEALPDGGFRTGRLLITQSIMGPQGAEAVIFWTSFPDGDRAHPCDNLRSPSVGPSTADLANAVATAHGTELVEGPSNVTVGRQPARHVVLTVRRDLGCDPGFFYTWQQGELVGEMWPGSNVGDTIRVWIVDVDDKRLFFEAETTTQADADLEKEIEQIIRSIRFD